MPTKPKKKQYVKFDEAVTSETRSLLQLSPENPTFRAHLLSDIKVAPPDDIKTYKELVDWVESNVEKKYAFDPDMAVATFRVPLHRKEWGRCDYEATTKFDHAVALTNLEIFEIAQQLKAQPNYSGMNRLTAWAWLRDRMVEALRQKVTEAIEQTGDGDSFVDNMCSVTASEEHTSEHERSDNSSIDFGNVQAYVEQFASSMKYAMPAIDPQVYRKLSS